MRSFALVIGLALVAVLFWAAEKRKHSVSEELKRAKQERAMASLRDPNVLSLRDFKAKFYSLADRGYTRLTCDVRATLWAAKPGDPSLQALVSASQQMAAKTTYKLEMKPESCGLQVESSKSSKDFASERHLSASKMIQAAVKTSCETLASVWFVPLDLRPGTEFNRNKDWWQHKQTAANLEKVFNVSSDYSRIIQSDSRSGVVFDAKYASADSSGRGKLPQVAEFRPRGERYIVDSIEFKQQGDLQIPNKFRAYKAGDGAYYTVDFQSCLVYK